MTVVWGWCGGLPSCLPGESGPCDLGVAQVILFPQTLPFCLPGGENLGSACCGLAFGPRQTEIALRFPAEAVGLMFHFHILAGAQLGEVTPTQARAGTSHGMEAWLHVLLSHPGVGAASPPGMPDLWKALLSSVWRGSAGSAVVQCPTQGFCALCSSGVPTLLSPLLGWCMRGWTEGLGVLLVPAGGQFGAACALSSTVYPESQPFCWAHWHRALAPQGPCSCSAVTVLFLWSVWDQLCSMDF